MPWDLIRAVHLNLLINYYNMLIINKDYAINKKFMTGSKSMCIALLMLVQIGIISIISRSRNYQNPPSRRTLRTLIERVLDNLHRFTLSRLPCYSRPLMRLLMA